MLKKILWGLGLYIVLWILAQLLAQPIAALFGPDVATRYCEWAYFVLLLPPRLVAMVISWFSATPGAIDDAAIERVVMLALALVIIFVVIPYLWRKIRG